MAGAGRRLDAASLELKNDVSVRAGCCKKTENERVSRAVPPSTVTYDIQDRLQAMEHAQAA